MKREVVVHGKDLALPKNLHRHLEVVLDGFSLRTDINRLSVNFRDTSYYHRREGLHPVEMRFERDEDNRHIWKLGLLPAFLIQMNTAQTLHLSCTLTLNVVGSINQTFKAVSLQGRKSSTYLPHGHSPFVVNFETNTLMTFQLTRYALNPIQP